MQGEDEEDSSLLKAMARDAEAYLRSFSWCSNVSNSYSGGGVGGVFAIFLFNIHPMRPEIGTWMWAIVGDVPFAYLPLEDASSAREVFNVYVRGMNRWVEFARLGRSGTPDDGVPPVDVPPTREWAEKVEHRIHSLVLIMKPFFDGDAVDSEQVN